MALPWEFLSDPPRAMLPPLLPHLWGPGAETSHGWSVPGQKGPGLGKGLGSRGYGPSLPEGEDLAEALDPGRGVEPGDQLGLRILLLWGMATCFTGPIKESAPKLSAAGGDETATCRGLAPPPALGL